MGNKKVCAINEKLIDELLTFLILCFLFLIYFTYLLNNKSIQDKKNPDHRIRTNIFDFTLHCGQLHFLL